MRVFIPKQLTYEQLKEKAGKEFADQVVIYFKNNKKKTVAKIDKKTKVRCYRYYNGFRYSIHAL